MDCKGNLTSGDDFDILQVVKVTCQYIGVRILKNRVEALRKSMGLSQEKFARMMRVSRQTISAIETGKYNPSLELAFAISDCFGEPIEKIFLYHDDTDDTEGKNTKNTAAE